MKMIKNYYTPLRYFSSISENNSIKILSKLESNIEKVRFSKIDYSSNRGGQLDCRYNLIKMLDLLPADSFYEDLLTKI